MLAMNHTVPKDYRDHDVCIIGLGYVGLTLAVSMAEIGFNVLGIEKRADVVKQLVIGQPHFHEPKLPEVLKRVKELERFSISDSIPEGLNAKVFIITVGTPLGENGLTRLDMVEAAAKQVASCMKAGSLIIMRSTLKLGTTRNVVKPILDGVGCAYDLAFCPERTIEGHALTELRQLPQIVSGDSYEATLRASTLFQFLTPTVVKVRDLETAEMIKLVDNAQRDVHFAYSNEIARICDAVGVSAIEVIRAGKLGYPRTNLFMPGPVGGPCLSKDSHILNEGLSQYHIQAEMTAIARKINERQPEEIADFLAKKIRNMKGFSSSPVISLLGLAFKGQPATDDLRGSMALPIFQALKNVFKTAIFRGYDACVSQKEINGFGLIPCIDLESAFTESDLVIILNNHTCFSSMPIFTLAEKMKKPGVIYDFWNHFSDRELPLPEGTGYIGLGHHSMAQYPVAV
jgi:UDP-N-acetyl-D-mannosaminuronic acid dehydrogenase